MLPGILRQRATSTLLTKLSDYESFALKFSVYVPIHDH